MSIFDDWATYIAKSLKADSELVGALAEHRGELGSAREEVIRQVLNKLLPSNFRLAPVKL